MSNEKMSEFEQKLREQLELQFQRGMYVAAYGLSGAIREMIENLHQKPKKRLSDYQSTLADIHRLCTTKLNNLDTPTDDTKKESE